MQRIKALEITQVLEIMRRQTCFSSEGSVMLPFGNVLFPCVFSIFTVIWFFKTKIAVVFVLSLLGFAVSRLLL